MSWVREKWLGEVKGDLRVCGEMGEMGEDYLIMGYLGFYERNNERQDDFLGSCYRYWFYYIAV